MGADRPTANSVYSTKRIFEFADALVAIFHWQSVYNCYKSPEVPIVEEGFYYTFNSILHDANI